MRIAIVDPYFAVGLGYQTTGWFSAFVAQGHHVRAFSSCVAAWSSARHLYHRSFSPGMTSERGGEVLRLPALILPRDVALSSGLLARLFDFRPQATLVVYPGTLFAREVIENRPRLPGAFFTTFGENRAQRRAAVPSLRHTLGRAAVDLAFYLFKRRHYRKAIEFSDAALMHTPDTVDYLLSRIAVGSLVERLRSKCVLWPLGFDACDLHLDEKSRAEERAKLGIASDDVVIMYSGRIEAVKRFDVWVSMVASAMRSLPKLRGMLIGFREGEVESNKVRSCVSATGLKDRFLCLPFADRQSLARLYNAADIGLWHLQPSVGIQESMGTGCYMILPADPTMSHLLREPVTGRYFREGDFDHSLRVLVQVAEAFSANSPLATLETRRQRADLNFQAFSYQSLAARLAKAAREPDKAVAWLRSGSTDDP